MRFRGIVLGVVLVVAGSCGSPTGPKPPDPPVVDPATAPIIRSIAVPTARVEAGIDVTITAVVEDAETPLTELTYQWATSAGTIAGSGLTATWQIPEGLTAGVDVTVTLTVVDTYDAVVSNQIVQRQFVVAGTSAAFRVHDSETELMELARKFLIDLFGNSAVPPEACMVDFSTVGRCAEGRDEELGQIRDHRELVVVLSAQIFAQTVTHQSSTEATVVSEAKFYDRWLNPTPEQPEFDSTHADFTTTAIYDAGRWWLCESTHGNKRGPSALLDALDAMRAKRGKVRK
jgi:hypothetical protein